MGSYEHRNGFPMNMSMRAYVNSYGFLCKRLWVPMNMPMCSYEIPDGFLWTCLWFLIKGPMAIPIGS